MYYCHRLDGEAFGVPSCVVLVIVLVASSPPRIGCRSSPTFLTTFPNTTRDLVIVCEPDSYPGSAAPFAHHRGLVIAYRVLRRSNSSVDGDQQLPINAFDSRPRVAVESRPANTAATPPDDANTDEIEFTYSKDEAKSREAHPLNFSDAYGTNPKIRNSMRVAGGHEGVRSDIAAEIGALLPKTSTGDAVTGACERGAVEGSSAGSSGNVCGVSPDICDVKSPSEGSAVSSPLVMVVVPGLFQTLDTLEIALMPLIEACHSSASVTVLLVAPPGLPNTHWPVTATLDGEVNCAVSR